MAELQPDPEIRQAVYDLQRYLSDQVAPLMVADSIEMLTKLPPTLAAKAIEGWVAAQYRGSGEGATMSDYLFHAMKKIQAMAQLKLIEAEPLNGYLQQLGSIVVELCPAEDREAFMTTLRSLGQSEGDLQAGVQLLHMQAGVGGARPAAGRPAAGAAAGPGAQVSEELARGLKRFTLMVERLEKDPKVIAAIKAGAGGQQAELMSQIVATAALSSRSGADLDQYIKRLTQLGVDARTEEIFKALGRSLPGWVLPAGGKASVEAEKLLVSSRPAEAMRRLVSMAGSPQEGIQRFTEMVQAAIEQFNQGRLTQAAAMFEVADRLVHDKKVDAENAKVVRNRAQSGLGMEYLRAFAEKPEKHGSLRKVLGFFPALTVAGLLADLDGEQKRDRRKLLLALLEVHGPAAREAALEALEARVARGEPDPEGYFTRNMVYLLRRLPRPGDEVSDKEIDLLSRAMRWGSPLIVIKEAIGALGQIHHKRAEQALMARLQEYEATLLSEGGPPVDAVEIRVLLDRTAASLARFESPNAWRTVVNHALRREPALGNAMARMADLSCQDLASDKELTDLLVGTLRARLPKKVLGFVMQKKSEDVLHLVQALSGTQSAAARQILQEVAEKYNDQDFGTEAGKALSPREAPARAAEPAAMSLAGDLDLFGLPSLLQTVADAKMSGQMSLTDREGRPHAAVSFETGKIKECQLGALAGEAAFFQLLERPVPGTFVFKSRKDAPASADGAAQLLEVLPSMLEAMRRHDEFQQARALVPDDATFKAGGVRPTGPPEGEEPDFLRNVWERASAGATPAACEAAVPVDSYRIRRLYAHWVEQGALQAK